MVATIDQCKLTNLFMDAWMGGCSTLWFMGLTPLDYLLTSSLIMVAIINERKLKTYLCFKPLPLPQAHPASLS